MSHKILKSKYGHDVSVGHTIEMQTSNFLHVVKVEAIVGGVRETKNITIGAVDGPRPEPPSTTDLQTMVDTHKQEVVDEASWKESVRTALLEVK